MKHKKLALALSAVILLLAVPVAVSAIVQNIFVASNRVTDIKIGDTQISKVYVGSELIWERCTIPVGQTYTYSYTGNSQSLVVPCDGNYQIQLWGAEGGVLQSGATSGKGGYVKGIINLLKNESLYVYVGQKNSTGNGTAFNAGSGSGGAQPGGGATDIRLTNANASWSNLTSLRSRIIVAAGGGAGVYYGGVSRPGGGAGGLTGISGAGGTGATQTVGGTGAYGYSSGTFGVGGNGYGGGGGYYGGGGSSVAGSGAGGSSFISGHYGCNAINSSGAHTNQANHYSGKVFASTIMIDGAGYKWTNVRGPLIPMPNPSTGGNYATGTGHTGHGVAKITYLGP